MLRSETRQARTRCRLEELLDEALACPERRQAIVQRIEAEFGQARAVLVADLDSFTASTVEHGIVPFLMLLRQVRQLTEPVFHRHHGRMLHPEADTLFGLFEAVEDALAAAGELHRVIGAHAYPLGGGSPVTLAVGIGWGFMLNVEDQDVMGAEVNFAYKLGEEIGSSGDILLTQAAREQLPLPEAHFEKRVAQLSGLQLTYYSLRGET